MGRYYLLGHPLGHSLSRPLHRGLFGALGVKAEYSLMDTPAPELAKAVALLRERADGFNVTIPYKESILPFLDEIHPSAALFGAVNTVAVRDGRLFGYNTDADGFALALGHYGIECAGRRAAVLGAGGAARMMAAQLSRMGADVDIAARDTQKALRLSKDLVRRGLEREPGAVHISALSGGYNLIFNGTPVGMYPDTGESPVTEQALAGADTVFDTIYNPLKTQLLRMADARGLKTANGLVMLAAQAAAAQELWTGMRHRRKDILDACGPLAAALALSRRNLVLCGMPGSGKTTLGRRLADALGFDFFDVDEIIEKRHGMSVSELFEGRGEEYFRKEERAEALRLAGRERAVIATGGGTLLNPQSAAALKKNALVVFLDVPLRILTERLRTDQSRPLLAGGDLEKRLAALWQSRRPAYLAAADIRLCGYILDEQCKRLYKAITDRGL